MRYVTTILLLVINSNLSFSQMVTLDKEIVYMFSVDKLMKRNMGGIDYWSTKSDSSALTRLHFCQIYAGHTIDVCSKGDTLGPDLWTITNIYRLMDFDRIEKELFDKAKRTQTFVSQGERVKVYKVLLSGQFCKCAYKDFDGEIIPLYIPLEQLKVDSAGELKEARDLSKFNFHFFQKVKTR